ncbi:glycosyltransferase [Ancylobacter sp. 6x-1]|uniref:Glycosyltransferase n=1 Tax=Ancylobacter crimeensis TaxID=2579147 RepID=A0ABT0D5T7_9HYPH|nr:glycosyltransferase [Ancylobacter crimeensis]MCK0195303.1 glycosyltransferase [Ancylobacter crimeensis]
MPGHIPVLRRLGGCTERLAGLYGTVWDAVLRPCRDECRRTMPSPTPVVAAPSAPGNLPIETKPEVSILLVSRNDAPNTLLCIEHIEANDAGPPSEILIADNGSAPDDLALLNEGRGRARILPLGVDRYRGEARNILAEQAQGRFVCFLDTDVLLSPRCLEGLMAELDAHPEAAAAGPILLAADGTIEQAGAMLDGTGEPSRHLAGPWAPPLALLPSRSLDYVSASCLLVRREDFAAVHGFDLAFEPEGCEDIDLCLKLAALGKSVRLLPAMTAIRSGERTPPDDMANALNRAKLRARWGAYLRHRSSDEQQTIRAAVIGDPSVRRLPSDTSRALVYTPYALTPGGGERYLCTTAAVLSERWQVILATPHPYSRMRLRQIGRLFDIDLDACQTVTLDRIDDLGPFEVMLTMGNHLHPPTSARAARNLFHCQFPFPYPGPGLAELDGYERFIVNSGFTAQAVEQALQASGSRPYPIHVIAPPVPQFGGDARTKKPMILSVGRFFVGGHSKQQDLLIEAFRALIADGTIGGELHLAGSSTPGIEHMDYLRRLEESAEGLPIVFHVNCSADELAHLYRDAAIYWHGTGLGVDLTASPEKAEHFGIAIVEAMAAGSATFAFRAGGAREIIEDGVNGLLYESLPDLVERTRALLIPDGEERRIAIGRAGSERAAAYAPDRFAQHMRDLFFRH